MALAAAGGKGEGGDRCGVLGFPGAPWSQWGGGQRWGWGEGEGQG